MAQGKENLQQALSARSGAGGRPAAQRPLFGGPRPSRKGLGGERARPPRSPELSVEECRARGAEVRSSDVLLGPGERETGIAYIEGEKQAELSVGDYKLQRKLERAGFVPQVVNQFKAGGSIRLYYIPKARLSVNIRKAKRAK